MSGRFKKVFLRFLPVHKVRVLKTRRHKLLFVWILAIAVLGYVGLHVSAEPGATVRFYPNACAGDWQNPEHASGWPENFGGTAVFSDENSAKADSGLKEISCSDFKGDAPTDRIPKTFTLKFSWFITSNTLPDTGVVPTTDANLPQNSLNNSSSDATSTPLPSSSDATENTAPENTLNANPTDTPPPDSSVIVLPAPDASATPDQQAPPPSIVSPPAPADNNPSPDSSPIVSFFRKIFQPSEVRADNTPDTPVPREPDAVEVFYTTDGSVWKSVGTVNASNWQNASFALNDPALQTWDDVSKIQIRVRTLATDTSPAIYIDNAYIEADSILPSDVNLPEPPKIKLTDPSVMISGDKAFSLENNPKFIITDPKLTPWKIVALVDEGKAQVVEDKDGVLNGILGTRRELLRSQNDSQNAHISAPADSAGNGTPAGGENSLPADPLDSLNQTVLPILNNTAQTAPSASGTPPNSSPATPAPAPAPEEPTTGQTAPSDALPGAPSASSTPISRLLQGGYQPKFSLKNNLRKALDIFSAQIANADTTPNIQTEVVDAEGNPTAITAVVTSVTVGGVESQQIEIQKPAHEFKPGKYTLKVTLSTDGATIVSQQDFTWGVLAINTDKSVYEPGDDAYLQMGVLSDTGDTICGADMTLDITSPSGTVSHFMTGLPSSAPDAIVREPACGPNNVIFVPDYYAHYAVPQDAGTYTMMLTATTANGTKTITDHFDVAPSVPFAVVRAGPTRIYPVATYPMTLYVTPVSDWQGTITEEVPASFDITSPDHSTPYDSVTTSGDAKII